MFTLELPSRAETIRDKKIQVAGKYTAVFGLYRTRTIIENAADTLKQEGFRGPVMVVGPIMAALAGAGGVVGGIAGALIGTGIPEYEAKRYEGRIKRVESCSRCIATVRIG